MKSKLDEWNAQIDGKARQMKRQQLASYRGFDETNA
jgi:hypothetical protein